MDAIRINRKFEPLFFHTPGVRYYVVTGGRAPGKSFAVATAMNSRTYDTPHNTIFARYSMTSAEISVIPEFTEKMDLCGNRMDFATKDAEIRNLVSGATIYFKGIIQSRKNNDARLKSVQDVERLVLDEAQELIDMGKFDVIDLSIRLKGAPCEVWLVLNPTDIHHWIYKRFFKQFGVPDDYNGIIGNTCYIHTTYLENLENLDPTFIALANEMKERDYDKYKNIFLGYWARKRKGLIYPSWQEVLPADIPLGLEWWYCNDWGYSGDPNALCRMAFDALTRTLYVVEVMYSTGKLTRDVARAVREDCEATGMSADAALVYCDPARPDNIAELRTIYGINAVPGINRDKPGRIGYLQGFRVKYVGRNIGEEAATYSWEPSKEDPEVFTDTPQDGGDHAMDAISYGTTHLRRMGIPNDDGERLRG